MSATAGSRSCGVGERAVGRLPADDGALGAREELVPGAVQRGAAVDPDLVLGGRGDQLAHGVLVQVLLEPGRQRGGDADGQFLGGVAQRGGRGGRPARASLGVGLLRRPGRAAGRPPRGRWRAPRRPGRPRPSPRRRAARWPAGRSTPRRGRSSGPRGRGRPSRASGRAPGRASPSGGTGDSAAVGRRPDDVRGDGVVALAEHGGGDRHVLADHGAGRERPAGHDGGDIGDAEAEVRAASHRRNAIEVPSHQHLGSRSRHTRLTRWGAAGDGIRSTAAGGAARCWLVSTGASSSSVHRPRGAARTPAAPVPARDEPPVVLAPGDARPLRDARPRALAELRRRPGQGARRGLRRAAGRAGQGPQVRPPAAGRRRRPAGVPDDAALVPVARGRGAGEHRLLLGGVRRHRGAAASTPAAWASWPATTSRPRPTSASR